MFSSLLLQSPTVAQQASGGPAKASVTPVQVVPLYASGSRAFAMLTLGDGPPAPVVFDTGEDQASLIASYAKPLKLAVIGSSLLVDEATGTRSTVPLLKLSSPRLSGVPVDPPETRMINYNEQDMVGIFGPAAFTGRLVTLELSHNRLRISPFSAEALPQGKATPYIHHLPALEISVAGLPVMAHLDSGSDGGLGLSRALMTKVKLKRPPVVVGQAISVSGTQDVYGSQIDGDVKIGPLILHDPEVSFIGSGLGANVGYKLMRQLTVVMDPAGQRSWVLDPASDSAPLHAYVGRYGSRSITLIDGALIYQRDGRPPSKLIAIGSGLFENPATDDRIQFHVRNGRAVSLDLIASNGNVASAARDT